MESVTDNGSAGAERACLGVKGVSSPLSHCSSGWGFRNSGRWVASASVKGWPKSTSGLWFVMNGTESLSKKLYS